MALCSLPFLCLLFAFFLLVSDCFLSCVRLSSSLSSSSSSMTRLTWNKNVCVCVCVRCERCVQEISFFMHGCMNGRMNRLAFLRACACVRVRADMCVSVGCKSFFLLLGNFP